jgi:uncharacterized Tic20 family protein
VTDFDAAPIQPQPAPPFSSQPAPPTGALSYALGFLAFIGIPFLSVVTAGIVMAAIYPSMKKKGALAAENARQAANWGYTLIIGTIITVGGHFVLLYFVSGTPVAKGFYPVGILITLFGALCVAHLVILIMGLVKANGRGVLNNRLAIPFIRRPGHEPAQPAPVQAPPAQGMPTI